MIHIQKQQRRVYVVGGSGVVVENTKNIDRV